MKYYLSYYLPKASRIQAPVMFSTDSAAAFQKELARCDKYGYSIVSAFMIGDREIRDVTEEVHS